MTKVAEGDAQLAAATLHNIQSMLSRLSEVLRIAQVRLTPQVMPTIESIMTGVSQACVPSQLADFANEACSALYQLEGQVVGMCCFVLHAANMSLLSGVLRTEATGSCAIKREKLWQEARRARGKDAERPPPRSCLPFPLTAREYLSLNLLNHIESVAQHTYVRTIQSYRLHFIATCKLSPTTHNHLRQIHDISRSLPHRETLAIFAAFFGASSLLFIDCILGTGLLNLRKMTPWIMLKLLLCLDTSEVAALRKLVDDSVESRRGLGKSGAMEKRLPEISLGMTQLVVYYRNRFAVEGSQMVSVVSGDINVVLPAGLSLPAPEVAQASQHRTSQIASIMATYESAKAELARCLGPLSSSSSSSSAVLPLPPSQLPGQNNMWDSLDSQMEVAGDDDADDDDKVVVIAAPPVTQHSDDGTL